MQYPLRATFINRIDARKVFGQIRLASDIDIKVWSKWLYSEEDEDSEWDWSEIFGESQSQPHRYECYAAEAGGQLQGLARLDLDVTETAMGAAITLDYLATSPANRHGDRGFKLIGLALIGAAILRSRETKAKGGIWLESLPGAATFYENLGMVQLLEKSADNYDIYVLPNSDAQRVLEKLIGNGILAV